MPVNPKSLLNLQRPPKGQKLPCVSPGRPPTRGLVEMIRRDYAKNPEAIVNLLKKRKPELYCAYGFGKPAETLNIGGIPDQPLVIEHVEALTIPQLKERLAALKAKAQTPEANG